MLQFQREENQLKINGQLVILVAGNKALYDQVQPSFDILGKKLSFLGEGREWGINETWY